MINLDKLCLFHVKDADRPMYVLAINWQKAVTRWKEVIAIENEMEAEDVTEPLGVNFICNSEELII